MITNTQKREPLARNPNGLLALHHCFRTIQGEGPFAGTPAVFVRLFGCNIQCPFCDTDYTSRKELTEVLALVHQVQQIAGATVRLVVITGGEPFRQNITPLTRALLSAGFKVQVETNGTLFLSDFPFHLATVVCSPKTPKIDPELAEHCHAFKYVVEAGKVNQADGLPLSTLGTEHGVARPPPEPAHKFSSSHLTRRMKKRTRRIPRRRSTPASASGIAFAFKPIS